MTVIPLAPGVWSDVYYGDERHTVIALNGTTVFTLPAQVVERWMRSTHQGNLQNADGEYQWRV